MNLLRPLDRFLTVNGLRLHVLDWGGDGRTPLLLLHGFTGHAHAWDTLSIALQPHFHVYALDQRGHGDSDPADTYESIEQAAQHLYRGNPYPGIHYYRWVVSDSLRQRPDGALVWAWHPSVKERRSQLDIDWWAVLRAITPETLVLRGERSTVLDRDVAERMARELPRGRFVEIPRAVHTLHEDNPEAVLAAPNDFLKF